jgi:hypothetical protein
MHTHRKTLRRRRPARQREGAVMMVVLLILMVATASAAVSIQTTQSELRAAGHERVGMQAHYASEAAMIGTVAWIDMLGESGQFLEVLDTFDGLPLSELSLLQFAEPDYRADGSTRHHASRSSMRLQVALQDGDTTFACPTTCLPPLTRAGDASGDAVGSFGPRQAYQPTINADGNVDYAVDINDCMEAPSAAVPGAPLGGGQGSVRIVQFYCVLTARGRVHLDFANEADRPAARTWNQNTVNYDQARFTSAHDSRATILTPQMIAPGQG